MFSTKRVSGIAMAIVIWQSKNTQVAQGGFTLDDTLPVGTLIAGGTPIFYDESTRLAKVYKSGVAQANADETAVSYKVLKGHNLSVGMSVKSGESGAKKINAIDVSDPTFDLITLASTLGVAVKKGTALSVDDLEGNYPQGLLYSNVEVADSGITELTVVIRGTVYARRIVPVSKMVREKMPNIIFSESF